MNEPIMEFKDDKELQECLKEWQERLFLTDWIIKASLGEDDSLDDVTWGESAISFENRSADIRINKLTKFKPLTKTCAEKILIHELLEIKTVRIENPQSLQSSFFDDCQHSYVEQMAKSLIMAKYNLPFDWFKNF